ncbi:MAG: family transporter protein [Paenibacillaceae bacterium]|jgi:ABC-type transport system involved in multi-copper enzyme maturation permease subunit|nr:family transporter protein [Paenibacillaceae bacterium]
MRQLILKDFAIQRRSSYLYLAMGLLFFFYMTAMDQHNMMSVMMPVFVIVYSFINRSMHEDEKNHATRLLLCLPVPRDTLVKAKYASVALIAFVTTAILSIIGLLGGALSFETHEDRVLNLLIAAVITCCYSFLVSILIPTVYKMGVAKAQAYNRFFFLGLILLGGGSGTIIRTLKSRFDFSAGPPAWLQRIGNSLAEISPYVWILVLFCLALSMFLISMRISIRYFDKREDI